MPMDFCHILLGRHWQFDRKAIHDGRCNTYTFEKDEHKHTLIPLKDENVVEEVSPKVLMVSGKEFLHQINKEEVNFSLIGKPKVILTSTKLVDLSLEI